jgi:hypothetical protein
MSDDAKTGSLACEGWVSLSLALAACLIVLFFGSQPGAPLQKTKKRRAVLKTKKGVRLKIYNNVKL